MPPPSTARPPAHPVRFVTAASLFDGHDAAITVMRRILQRHGAEVVHLGHNRSVDEVVTAAVQEDVRSEEHTSELQSRQYLVCRLLLEKKKTGATYPSTRAAS